METMACAQLHMPQVLGKTPKLHNPMVMQAMRVAAILYHMRPTLLVPRLCLISSEHQPAHSGTCEATTCAINIIPHVLHAAV